ncbi:BLUF domain-containing protein [Caulobacter soli]|uniref:BLUF domain-containing protein n=1 Tax=Caulobacter soli TaxID=2708539 RepID=UPI0013E9FA78|nr:BLUF domain-containing protein [Caulobacter soli]
MFEFDDAPKGLARLIYASRSTQPGGPGLSEQVRIITAKSIHNNRLANITGFLAFGADRFLQLLEGPVGEIDATFERIRHDDRHTDLVVIGRAPVERRMFRDWNMAQHQVSAVDQGLLADAGLTAFAPDQLDEDGALKLLGGLGGRYRR